MGGLFGGSSTKTTSNETADSGPSKFQQPYLTGAFNDAQNLYNSQKGTPYYQGETYAGLSDSAKAALQSQIGYAQNTGLGTANQLNAYGQQMLGYGQKAGDTLNQYLDLANGDATSANIAAANKYAANPFIQDQIDASAKDVTRNLNEDTLPSIDRQASAGGNLNSSRAGVAAGIAQRGAQDKIADISAQLRSQAYSQGLTMAQQDRSNQLNALGQAAQGYAGFANQGVNALSAGSQAANGAFSAINQANGILQQDQQGKDDAAFNQWQGQDQREQQLLDNYFKIVGGNQWGQSATSSGTSTQKQSGGLLNSILGAAAGGLGIASGLGWQPFGK